jgi:hypothetical protein
VRSYEGTAHVTPYWDSVPEWSAPSRVLYNPTPHAVRDAEGAALDLYYANLRPRHW